MAEKKKVEKKEKKPPFYMEKGKSVTSMRGVLGPGDEVKAKFFKGGEDVLKNLVEKEFVVDTLGHFKKKAK